MSRNTTLVVALATVVMKGGVRVTIQGTAVIDVLLFSWSVPFGKTMPVTMEQVGSGGNSQDPAGRRGN